MSLTTIKSTCPICNNNLVITSDCNTCVTCVTCGRVFDTSNMLVGQYIDTNPCEYNTIFCLPEKGMIVCGLCKKEWCVDCVEKCDIFEKHKGKYDNFMCKICNKRYLS